MMLLPFSACDGILEGIYDSPAASDSNEFGFIRTDPSTHSGTIYIDATDYRRWTFIDFHTQKVDSVNVTDSDQKEPEEWDIAVHRYDVKTNAGAVLETGFTGFSALQNASAMPEGVYGTYAAVRLTNYMNASGVKGFMTIDYIYPFEL